jgi:hypothetical protein
MTPERMAALEAEAADDEAADEDRSAALRSSRVRLDEKASPVAGRRFTRT